MASSSNAYTLQMPLFALPKPHKRKHGVLPPLTPPTLVAAQLPLPCCQEEEYWRTTKRVQAQIDEMVAGDALVFGCLRLEYVQLISGYPQMRLYRGDHIIQAAYLKGDTSRKKRAFVPLILAQGCLTLSRLEPCAAFGRRRTRRTFAKAA